MLFCQQTQKTHSYYHSVTVELPFILTIIGRMNQTRPTGSYHTLLVYHICHNVGRCVESGGCSLSSLKWKVNGQYWWDILLNTISTNFNCYRTRCRWQYYLPFSNTAHACTIAWCAQQFNSCCTKLSTLFLLSYGPNRPQLNSI